jgi:hypothetical protein
MGRDVATTGVNESFSSYRANTKANPNLRLSRQRNLGGTGNYNISVRPMVEQGYLNRGVNSQTQRLRPRELQSISIREHYEDLKGYQSGR